MTESNEIKMPPHVSEIKINAETYKLDRIMDDNSEQTQLVAFPRYQHDRFHFVTSPIVMSKGGIPKISEKWRPTDNHCMYFWLPFDENDEGSKEVFENVFIPVDEFNNGKIMTENNKDFVYKVDPKGVKKPMKSLFYSHAIKMSPSSGADDDDVDVTNTDKNKNVPYKRVKVTFATEYNKNRVATDPKKIKTVLYVNNPDGSEKDEPENVSSLADFRKHFVWKCTVQFVLEINKFWIKKDIDAKLQNRRECSFTVKCLQMLILNKPEQQVMQLTRSVFGNYGKKAIVAKPVEKKPVEEDSEDDAPPPTNKKADKTKKPVQEESSDDEEDVPPPPPTNKKIEKPKKPVKPDSSDDDDVSPPPPTTKSKKTVVQPDSSDDSESSESEPEPEPKKSAKSKK